METQAVRSEKLTVRFRRHERQLLEEVARAERTTPSDWIRDELLRAARRAQRRRNHLDRK